MFPIRKQKSVLEKAGDFVGDVADRIAPHVETAKDQLSSAAVNAKDKAGPALADARDRAVPVIQDARDRALPVANEARDRFVKDVVPAVSAAVASTAAQAREQAQPLADEARRRGEVAIANLRGEEPPKQVGGVVKKLLLVGVLAAVGGVLFKRFRTDESQNWQTSYTPVPPAPAAPPATPHGDPLTDSSYGADPAEAAADQIADGKAHPVTDPEHPVTDTRISNPGDPRA